ncbi:MAG: 30S ribosomal protein S2, partial [Bacteroidales bacterium]|nr:30S ribosomal protein S2 [Bacteroidales bacterium]
VFIVDILKEHIAVAEAHRLNIPTFAIVDTNSNPNLVDFPIPANDDASKSIGVIVKAVCDAIAEGLSERKMDKDSVNEDEDEAMAEENQAEDEEENNDREEGQRRRRTTIRRNPARNANAKRD